MQPSVQHIFSQIIDSCIYFPERFCDFSCKSFKEKKSKIVVSFLVRGLQEIPKMILNVHSLSEVEFLQFLIHNLCGFDPGLEAVSR